MMVNNSLNTFAVLFSERAILDLGCRVLKAPQEHLDLRDHKDQKEILAFQGCQGLQDEQDLMERQDQKVQN